MDMADKVRLKLNMIVGGRFIRSGSIVDRDEIPLSMRKSKYIEEENAVQKTKLSREDAKKENQTD
jgi:hypothetical protein